MVDTTSCGESTVIGDRESPSTSYPPAVDTHGHVLRDNIAVERQRYSCVSLARSLLP